MFSKNEMNVWYRKSLDNYFSQDLTEKIIYIVNKESEQWVNLKENIKLKLKNNIFHNLLYFRKNPIYIEYGNNSDYYYFDLYRNNKLEYKIICKKNNLKLNNLKLKWINPMIWFWDENDKISD